MQEPKSKDNSMKESNKVLENFDGHHTKELRDRYNGNLKWAILAFIWNFYLVVTYRNWGLFLIDFFAFMLPCGLNVAWVFLKEEHQLKTVKHFRCCLRIPGEGELQCQPFRRRSTLFGKLRDNIQLNCESDLLYDITLNKVQGARAQRVI